MSDSDSKFSGMPEDRQEIVGRPTGILVSVPARRDERDVDG
jgi:hypothetical protein